LLKRTNFPTDIAGVYSNSTDADQELILNLALFLSNFLSNHLHTIENPAHHDVLLNAHLYMIKISTVEEREVFKICLEYWWKLVQGLYDEQQQVPHADLHPLMGLNLGPAASSLLGDLRKNTYSQVLSNLRLVIIERMVKPEEVYKLSSL
jgi:exportin-1